MWRPRQAAVLGALLGGLAGSAHAQNAATPLPSPTSPEMTRFDAQVRYGQGRDEAYGAYQRGFFITALRQATARLENDPKDAAAMTLLGELHSQGLGLPQDFAKAASWYRLAAGAGDRNALFALGMMALEGRGVPRNPQEGKRLLEEAAARGHPLASHNLALLLLPSESPEDVARAAKLLGVAAAAEIADAQHALGVLYAQGRGVEKNPEQAVRWYERAAANGSIAGEVEFAIALFNSQGIEKNETQAARAFARAAYRGNAIARNRLARLYAAGRGINQDRIEAAAWQLLAARQGLADTWLDQTLKDLSPEEQRKAEELAKSRALPD